MNLIARNGGLISLDSRLLVADGVPDCCCGPSTANEFYLGVRCDVYAPPPIPLPIPDTVPTHILIPAPFFCAGESCEIEGLRTVVYGGYCYVIYETDRTQPPPCGDRLLARRWRLEEFPEPRPPVVDPADIVCKPPGPPCRECLPVAPPGTCCSPEGLSCARRDELQCPPCFPCDCPRYQRYALLVRWSLTSKVSILFFDAAGAPSFVPAAELVFEGDVQYAWACLPPHTGARNVCSMSWRPRCFRDPFGGVLCPALCEPSSEPSCEDIPLDGEIFGEIPWRVIDAIVSRASVASCGFIGGFRFPSCGEFGLPCSGSATVNFSGPEWGLVSWSMSAGCFGGSYIGDLWEDQQAPPIQRARVRTQRLRVDWYYVPLALCSGDGGLLVSGAPIPLAARIGRIEGAPAPGGCAGCGDGSRREVP